MSEHPINKKLIKNLIKESIKLNSPIGIHDLLYKNPTPEQIDTEVDILISKLDFSTLKNRIKQ